MTRSVLFAGLCLAILVQPITAQLPYRQGDWQAWRGPNRDGLSKETGLLTDWPKDGPKLIWKIKGLGAGYSTPSVAGGRIFVMGTDQRPNDKTELVLALDMEGNKIWGTSIGTMAGGYPGPRSTPTVDGDAVYAISSDGNLACLDRNSGDLRWKKSFKKEFDGEHGNWAFAESPLIDGDKLICTPGGKKTPIVALNKRTGEVIWTCSITGMSKNNYTRAGYSSVIAAEVNGVRQYIQFLDGGVVGVSANDGKFLWNYDHPANGTANISTPLFHDGSVFAATDYGTGGGLAKIVYDGGKFEAKETYFLKEMKNHHGGMILIGDHLYGTNGNALLCINIADGKIAWKNNSVGKGSIFYADGKIYLRSERGPVALVDADPTKYQERGRFEQPDRSNQNAWPHPVVVGGRLYLRDQDILLCYDVKK